jgi:hypothetical protein
MDGYMDSDDRGIDLGAPDYWGSKNREQAIHHDHHRC